MSEINKSPWPGPKGLIPVTSGKAEDANVYNRNFLDSIHMEMRVIDSLEPDLTTKIFGVEYASPIMMPAFSHLNKVGKDGKKPMIEYAKAAKELNVLNWVGMEPNEEYAEISAVGANTVRIIKPFAAKGVLSVQDAIKAKEAGCKAIVVSHHHGRIPFGIAPLQILPRIKEVLKDSKMTIFVDCSMDTGYDAYKALALGADAVSVGRGILAPLLKEGKDGVVNKVKRMNEELSELMIYTGINDTKSFDPSVLYIG